MEQMGFAWQELAKNNITSFLPEQLTTALIDIRCCTFRRRQRTRKFL